MHKLINKTSKTCNLSLQLCKIFKNRKKWINDIRINKQIGGDIKYYMIDGEKYQVNLDISKMDEDEDKNLHVSVISTQNTSCIILLLYLEEKEGILQDISSFEGCITEGLTPKSIIGDGKKINKIGTKLMRIVLNICKKYGIKKLMLEDNSFIYCEDIKINLKVSHTLIRGKPWYAKIGFIPTNNTTSKYIKYNEKVMKRTLTSDFNFNKLFSKIDNRNKRKILKYISDNSEKNIMKTMEYILKLDCRLFYDIYGIVYDKLRLKILMNNEYIMNIQ
jgi:hypothetical protein